MRTNFPIILGWLVAILTSIDSGRFEGVDKITARDGVNDQSNQQEGNEPHKNHDELLS
jgi:hypothetical protein